MELATNFQRLAIDAVETYRKEHPEVQISEGFNERRGWGFHIRNDKGSAPPVLYVFDPGAGIKRPVPNLDA